MAIPSSSPTRATANIPSKVPASKVEVEAVFTAIETEPEQPESLPFTDVSSGEWYYDAVALCV